MSLSDNTVSTMVETCKLEEVTLTASSNIDRLTVTELFKLVGDLYLSLGYSNEVTVRVKGLADKSRGKLEFKPTILHFDDEEWVDND